jgi:Ca2+-binding EF-hand superfamily protein
LTASDPKAAEPVAAPQAVSYDGATLCNDIKETLVKRNSLSIRGLAQVFKQIDGNKNRNLDLGELENGLRIIGINLNEEQCVALLKYFDKDGNNTINFNEFLLAIRGELNDIRRAWIQRAYNKLDINGDG